MTSIAPERIYEQVDQHKCVLFSVCSLVHPQAQTNAFTVESVSQGAPLGFIDSCILVHQVVHLRLAPPLLLPPRAPPVVRPSAPAGAPLSPPPPNDPPPLRAGGRDNGSRHRWNICHRMCLGRGGGGVQVISETITCSCSTADTPRACPPLSLTSTRMHHTFAQHIC